MNLLRQKASLKNHKVVFANPDQLDMFGGSASEAFATDCSLSSIEGLIADIDNANLEKIGAALKRVQAELKILGDYDKLYEDPASSHQTGTETSKIEQYLSLNGGIERINKIRADLMTLRTQQTTLKTKFEALELAETS